MYCLSISLPIFCNGAKTYSGTQKAFVTERSELLEMHKKKWEEKMVLRREKEVEFLKTREKRVEEYENQLQLLRVQDSEEYNMVKIRLETDVQVGCLP